MILSLCVLLPLACPTTNAQIRDVVTDQKVERLFQRDESLRTSIQGARIDRQAEISRLEGRISKLEKSLGRSAATAETFRFIDLILTLSREFESLSTNLQANSLTTEVHKNATNDTQKEDGHPESETHELQTNTTNESSKDLLSPVDSQPTNNFPDKARETEDRQQRLRAKALQLIAEDYMASLKADILDAKIELMENSASLMSLQRLAGKGLASAPQLELQKIRRQAAEARYARLTKLQSGLRDLFPELFASLLPPPKDDSKTESSSKTPVTDNLSEDRNSEGENSTSDAGKQRDRP